MQRDAVAVPGAVTVPTLSPSGGKWDKSNSLEAQGWGESWGGCLGFPGPPSLAGVFSPSIIYGAAASTPGSLVLLVSLVSQGGRAPVSQRRRALCSLFPEIAPEISPASSAPRGTAKLGLSPAATGVLSPLWRWGQWLWPQRASRCPRWSMVGKAFVLSCPYCCIKWLKTKKIYILRDVWKETGGGAKTTRHFLQHRTGEERGRDPSTARPRTRHSDGVTAWVSPGCPPAAPRVPPACFGNGE